MYLADLSTPEIRALPKETPVLVPVAALEQHGQHLPVFTDSLLLAEVVRRAHESLSGQVLVAPLLWLGNSEHHLDFAGTLSASPRTYLDILGDLARNFIHHGFRRLIFINGHGGNDVPGRQATFEIRQQFRARTDLLLLFATYWQLRHPSASLPAGFEQQAMGHACEWETSMILRIRPELVKPWRGLPPVDFGTPFNPAHRAWVTQDRTELGHIGSPHLASAEKGEVLFQMFADDLLSLLRRVVAWDGQSWNG